MSDVETDGRRLENIRDPPGQKCVYIPPGDTAREAYRLATFRQYPRDAPLDPREFASNGFYYVGYRDRVKCFSCGQTSDNWVASDDVTDARWHDRDCRFIGGTEQSNIPIGFLFPNTSLQHLSLLRVNPRRITHQQQTRISHNTREHSETHTAIVENSSTTSSSPSNASNDMVAASNVTFTCLRPINPHMRSNHVRRQTFIEHSSTWPVHRIRATPADIADAGMYYLGERDRVKCWYCNGGLQNWERDDSPWEEHAKWFPLCEFVLQQKGVDFVEEIVARCPTLRRPALYNPANTEATRRISRRLNQFPTINQSISSNLTTPVIIDPRKEIEERDQKVEDYMKSQIASEALSLGFKEPLVKEALKRKLTERNRMFESVEELVGSLLDLDQSFEEEENPTVSSSQEERNGEESLADRMLRLEESKKCKSCHKMESCMVLIPCGHLACCVGCGGRVKKCPICREIIKEKVRSYLS